MRLGWHLGNDHAIRNEDWSIMQRVRPDVLVFLPSWEFSQQAVTQDDIRRILDMSPGCHVFLRPYIPPQALEVYALLPAIIDGARQVIDQWRGIIPDGQRHLQMFNEPNMPWRGSYQAGFEGFGSDGRAMSKLNDWFSETYRQLHVHDPATLIGFPPLTIGNADAWFTGDAIGPHYMHGPAGCAEILSEAQRQEAISTGPCRNALTLADEYLAHIYVHARDGLTAEQAARSAAYGQRFARYARTLPREVAIWITECGAPNQHHMEQPGMADALMAWLDTLLEAPQVQGLAFWILGKHAQWGNTWGNQGPLIERLARWQAEHPHVDAAPSPPAQRLPLPEDETATDPATMAEKLRWWAEEARRQLRDGHTPRADEILLSMIKLHYRLEEKLK